MSRSVSYPTEAEVVCFQYHESRWWCLTCDKEVDGDSCPDDFSDHYVWHDDEHNEWFCEDCDETVDLDDNGHGGDPHDVILDNEWYEFSEFLDWVREVCQDAWPSLDKADRWIGRENHVILENSHASIGVSEYCNLVSVWIVPYVSDYYPEHANLAYHWIAQIEPKFRKYFGRLRLIGCFSNGEAVYERIKQEV